MFSEAGTRSLSLTPLPLGAREGSAERGLW
jgi:hypothetical protein